MFYLMLAGKSKLSTAFVHSVKAIEARNDEPRKTEASTPAVAVVA